MQISLWNDFNSHFLVVPNLPIRGKGKKGKKKKKVGGKKYTACNSAEIRFFILITRKLTKAFH